MSAPKSFLAKAGNSSSAKMARTHPTEAQKTQAAVSKVTSGLYIRILQMKDRGVLKDSLTPATAMFEILEFYGDAVLQERVSKSIIHTKRFMNPQLMSTLRMYIVKNSNLAVVYDGLGLSALETIGSNSKSKADVVEAIIGELCEAEDKSAADSPLSDLIDFISYTGEAAYHEAAHDDHTSATTYSVPVVAHAPQSRRLDSDDKGAATAEVKHGLPSSRPAQHHSPIPETGVKKMVPYFNLGNPTPPSSPLQHDAKNPTPKRTVPPQTSAAAPDDGLLLYFDPKPSTSAASVPTKLAGAASAPAAVNLANQSSPAAKKPKKKANAKNKAPPASAQFEIDQGETDLTFRTTRTLSVSREAIRPPSESAVSRPIPTTTPSSASILFERTTSPRPDSIRGPVAEIQCINHEAFGPRHIREFRQPAPGLIPQRA